MRTAGAPAGVAVASAIALGIGSPTSPASRNHLSNSTMGSGSRSSSFSGASVSITGASLLVGLGAMDVGNLPPQLRPLFEALAALMRRRDPAIRQRARRLLAVHPYLCPDVLATRR